jgi:hypothetical protein
MRLRLAKKHQQDATLSPVQERNREAFMSGDSSLLAPGNFRAISWCCVAAFSLVAPRALAVNPVQLAPSSYVRKDFTVEDGLPDNNVNAIVQSQNGYLWVGT